MTIDEAIQHCDEVANACKETECAAEHRQLAEWLRELVRLRKIKPLVEKIALEKIGAKIDVLEASVKEE